jgi:hypothetical protein
MFLITSHLTPQPSPWLVSGYLQLFRHGSILSRFRQHHAPNLKGKSPALLNTANTTKSISTRQCATSSTAIPPPTMHQPNSAPGRTAPRLQTSFHQLCVAHALSRSGSVNSRRAPSFRTSTSSTTTATTPLVGVNNAFSSQTSSKKPQYTLSARIVRRFYLTCLDHLSLPLPSHTRPVTSCSQTQIG